MNYDSEEEKKLQKSLSEKLKTAREFMGDASKVKQLSDQLESLRDFTEAIQAKVKAGEELDDEEKKSFDSAAKLVNDVKKSIEDMQLLIGNSTLIQADAIFYHLKELAEKGNEEAKKAYEQLLPKYKKSLVERTQSFEDKN